MDRRKFLKTGIVLGTGILIPSIFGCRLTEPTGIGRNLTFRSIIPSVIGALVFENKILAKLKGLDRQYILTFYTKNSIRNEHNLINNVSLSDELRIIEILRSVGYLMWEDVSLISSGAEDKVLSPENIERVTEESINQLGGMKSFVNRGDKVILKPNIGWARRPEQAATTNPFVIKKVIELCYNAGASEVRVTDLPCNSASITFERTGIQKAAESVDGIVYYPKSHRVKVMNFKDKRTIFLPVDEKEIKSWPIFIDFLEADKVINIPVAKVHNLSKLSLGMKNWYGAISGRRNQLHQAIHESIASLAYHFSPDLTIIDAIRILIKNGPTGGLESDVKIKNTIIASRNQVGADAVATTLFGMKPEDIEHIKIASKSFGMGDYDLNKLNIIKKKI